MFSIKARTLYIPCLIACVNRCVNGILRIVRKNVTCAVLFPSGMFYCRVIFIHRVYVNASNFWKVINNFQTRVLVIYYYNIYHISAPAYTRMCLCIMCIMLMYAPKLYNSTFPSATLHIFQHCIKTSKIFFNSGYPVGGAVIGIRNSFGQKYGGLKKN